MRHRPGRPRAVVALLCAGLIAAGCASNDSTASSALSVAPESEPSASENVDPGGGSQSETGWGRIWDNVPTGFPRFPGSTIADPISPDPVSATYAVDNNDAVRIAEWMLGALEGASLSTDMLSGPLEDGGYVIESVGEGDCRIQTSVQPMGGLTFVIVRYGAACPPG